MIPASLAASPRSCGVFPPDRSPINAIRNGQLCFTSTKQTFGLRERLAGAETEVNPFEMPAMAA
jgi:hypothetical protein